MNQKAYCNKHSITETVKDTFWFVKQMPDRHELTEKRITKWNGLLG